MKKILLWKKSLVSMKLLTGLPRRYAPRKDVIASEAPRSSETSHLKKLTCCVILILLMPIYGDTKPSAKSPILKNNEEVYAVLVPRSAMNISSATAAVIKNIMKPGDKFLKDDIIVRLDSTVLELRKNQLAAELESKEAELKNKEDLYKLKSASKVEYLRVKHEYEKTKSQLAEVDYQISLCIVKAPYDGEIIEQKINEGELIKVNEPILYIVNNKELDVKMHIPFSWLHHIKIGDDFSFFPEGLTDHPPFKGKITRIVPQVDPVSQLTLVYGQIEDVAVINSKISGLWGGISGVVSFLAVPSL